MTTAMSERPSAQLLVRLRHGVLRPVDLVAAISCASFTSRSIARPPASPAHRHYCPVAAASAAVASGEGKGAAAVRDGTHRVGVDPVLI